MSESVVVELFGIPRARAGISRTSVPGTDLGDVLQALADRYPGLAKDCIDGRRLRSGFTANLGGRQFVTSPETIVKPGESVLILSVDAGG